MRIHTLRSEAPISIKISAYFHSKVIEKSWGTILTGSAGPYLITLTLEVKIGQMNVIRTPFSSSAGLFFSDTHGRKASLIRFHLLGRSH